MKRNLRTGFCSFQPEGEILPQVEFLKLQKVRRRSLAMRSPSCLISQCSLSLMSHFTMLSLSVSFHNALCLSFHNVLSLFLCPLSISILLSISVSLIYLSVIRMYSCKRMHSLSPSLSFFYLCPSLSLYLSYLSPSDN